MDLNAEDGDVGDGKSGVDVIEDNDKLLDRMRVKVEKRADLLAMTLQTVISNRKPIANQTSKNIQSNYKNDPFRKNLSSPTGVFNYEEKDVQFKEIK